MKHAFVENGVVTNVIWLYPHNQSDFPNAVPLGELSVHFGDTYEDGTFYRAGEKVLTRSEMLQAELETLQAEKDDMQAALAELGVTVDG